MHSLGVGGECCSVGSLSELTHCTISLCIMIVHMAEQQKKLYFTCCYICYNIFGVIQLHVVSSQY